MPNSRPTTSRGRALVFVAVLVATSASADLEGVEGYRTYDGSMNSTMDPYRGAAQMPLLRLAGHRYHDHIAKPAGPRRPGAREISNAVAADEGPVMCAARLSSYVWLWGQFVDHDIDLTPGHTPAEPMHIEVPTGDPFFDPFYTGAALIPLTRSKYDLATGHAQHHPRQQLNVISSWIDASNVYGSDEARARALRKLDGSGDMKTTTGDLLPFNVDALDNAGGPGAHLFLAGDVRANENVALTAMHTIWVREHNRQAKKLRRRNRSLGGEEIYQRVRAKVGALMQAITYNEFLPTILGAGALPPYEGWNVWVDGSIANEFSTAAYRFGHSMVPDRLQRLRRDGRPHALGHLALRDSFFAPHQLQATGVEPLLRGLIYEASHEVDTMVVDGLRNFLFGPPGAGGFDLAALNIQRGRDHGLADLNSARAFYGLHPYRDFYEITTDAELAAKLEELYGDIDEVDLWVGGLSEMQVPGAIVGPTFYEIIRDQFLRLRDGDRYFYKRAYRGNELYEIERTTLADVIRRNSGIRRELPENVFLLPY